MSFLLWLAAHLFLHNLWISVTVFLTKGLILFGLAYGATKLFPSLLAEHKHTIWFLIILGFVLLPVGRLFVPLVPIDLPYSNRAHSVSRLVTLPVAYSESVMSFIDASNVSFRAAVVTARRVLLLLPASIWMTGVVFFMLRYVGGRVALRRLAISSAVSQPFRLPLTELAWRLGIRREVSVVYSTRCAIPLTHGCLHPRIMLPAASRAWPDERLRAVLIHELTHIKRADCLSNAAVYLVCAFLWFNPFAWLAREFMLREAEMSCDRSVLTSGMKGTEYATAIVDIVRGAQGQLLLPGAYGIIGKKSLLRQRIRRVLDSSRQSSTLVRTGRTLLFCFSLLLLLFAMTYSLKAGEKLSAQTSHLFGAIMTGRLHDVQAAIDEGADVNGLEPCGETPLRWATMYNQNPAVITLLLKAGADAKAKNSLGKTAFDYAQGRANLEGTDAYRLLQQMSQ